MSLAPQQDDVQSSLWVILVARRQEEAPCAGWEFSSTGGAFQDVGSDGDGRSAAAVLWPQASCASLIQCGWRCGESLSRQQAAMSGISSPSFPVSTTAGVWRGEKTRDERPTSTSDTLWRRDSLGLQDHSDLVTQARYSTKS